MQYFFSIYHLKQRSNSETCTFEIHLSFKPFRCTLTAYNKLDFQNIRSVETGASIRRSSHQICLSNFARTTVGFDEFSTCLNIQSSNRNHLSAKIIIDLSLFTDLTLQRLLEERFSHVSSPYFL